MIEMRSESDFQIEFGNTLSIFRGVKELNEHLF